MSVFRTWQLFFFFFFPLSSNTSSDDKQIISYGHKGCRMSALFVVGEKKNIYIWELVRTSTISYMQHIGTQANKHLHQHCVNNDGLYHIFSRSLHSDSFLRRWWWIQRECSWGGWTWFGEELCTVLLNVRFSDVPHLGKDQNQQ